MLLSLLLIPLLGSVIILLIPENSEEQKNLIKNIAIKFSLLNFLVSIFLWAQFDSNTSNYQFVYEFSKLSFCHFNIGFLLLNLNWYVLALTINFLFLFVSHIGLLGVKLKKLFLFLGKFSLGLINKNSFVILVYLLILVVLLLDLLKIINILNILNINNFDYTFSNYAPNGNTSNESTYPVNCWGIPQSVSIIGSGLAVFGVLSRIGNCSPRLRVLGALGASGVSASTIAYQSALENHVSLNIFMYGVSKLIETGKFPSLEEIKIGVSDKQLEDFIRGTIVNSDTATVDKVVNEVKNIIERGNNYVHPAPNSSPNWDTNLLNSMKWEAGLDSSDFYNKLLDIIFNALTSVIRGVHVEGYLDDLLVQ